MHVHLVQSDIVWEDPTANRRKVTTLVERAAPAAGDMIVLPETAFTGFSLDTSRTLPDAHHAEAFLAGLARAHRCTVVGGLVAPDGRGRASNQSLAFSPEGQLLARYAKIQPFTLGGERKVHAPGERVACFDWRGIRVALLVCYDLRFPELFREATKQGAEMFVVIANWQARRYHHWLTLLEARAIENLAFVVGVNRCGTDPGVSYVGRSVAVSPHGHVIADAGERERVVTAAVDPEEIRSWRREFPALEDMR